MESALRAGGYAFVGDPIVASRRRLTEAGFSCDTVVGGNFQAYSRAKGRNLSNCYKFVIRPKRPFAWRIYLTDSAGIVRRVMATKDDPSVDTPVESPK